MKFNKFKDGGKVVLRYAFRILCWNIGMVAALLPAWIVVILSFIFPDVSTVDWFLLMLPTQGLYTWLTWNVFWKDR